MISIPGRIPIHIYPFFWLLIAMLGWLNSSSIPGMAIWAVVILFSVLIHEFGHALTAVLFGQQAEISLVGLGGLTKHNGPKLSRWKDFLIVLNGPLAGFLMFLIAYYFLRSIGQKNYLLQYAIEVAINVNLFWTLLNLLPVLPLDGGQLMRILLEGIFGVRGLKVAILISICLAGIIGLYFFSIQQVVMGALFFMLAFESYRTWEEIKSLGPKDADQDLQEMIKDGITEFKKGNFNGALEKFDFVRKEAPKGMLYVNATQYAARILAEQGYYKKAYERLMPIKNRLSIDYLRLLQQLAYRTQEWEEAVKIGEEAFRQEPIADTALINALSYAIMGKEYPSVGWLRSATQLGLPNIHQVIEKREFDVIRDSDTFKKWSSSI